MGDKGKWAKLHIGWDDDPHIDALELSDQARWCKFITYMKEHGTEGSIDLIPPGRALQHKFRVATFQEVLEVLKRLPNIVVGEEANSTVSSERFTTVSFKNWFRFQGDLSTSRVRKFRSNETAKRRGEEKRRDEMRKEEKIPPIPPLVSRRFQKPTAQEVEAYAQSIGFKLNGQYFVDRNEVAGWVWGKARHPIKDWKAVVRTWKENEKRFAKEDGRGTHDSQSVVDFKALARSAREAKKAREQSSTGTLPDGLRNHQELSDSKKPGSARGSDA